MLPYGLRADLQIPKQACQTQRGRVVVVVVVGARGGGGGAGGGGGQVRLLRQFETAPGCRIRRSIYPSWRC
jgi:hypothetical protein